MLDRFPSPTYLEHAILRTLHYFDILGLPLTATQLWEELLVPDPTAAQRWEGHHVSSLHQIQATLADSVWLTTRVDCEAGYYFLKDRQGLVAQALHRHALAQQKWKVLRRAAWWLAWVPFVEMLAASGSLAVYNTKASSDLDVLVVARQRRIWTARLGLLVVAQLLRRRRRHWDQAAPDKVCLNHYLTSASLLIAPAIRNEYTAVQYTHLIPVYGRPVYQRFLSSNAGWLKRYVMYHERPLLPSAHEVPANRLRDALKYHLEAILLEPIGDYVERAVEAVQRRFIVKHTSPQQGGRVVVSPQELAFHPHSRVEGILHALTQEVGQKTLL